MAFHLKYILSILILFSLALPLQSAEEKRPNIVIILADDLGYADLGCYGNQKNQTPALDQLAAEGMKFTDFHANGPMCSPTRAALLTGRYQQRVGIEKALPIEDVGIPQQSETFVERLQDSGYATAIMGKWHLGDLKGSNPIHHGFDTFKGHLTSATDYKSHIDRNGKYDWYHNEEVVRHDVYNTQAITEDSIEYIRSHQDEPFMLYVSHSAIHFPWMGPQDDAYRKEGGDYNSLTKLGPRGEAEDVSDVVKAMVEALDASTGEIMKTIRETGLEENTIVIFSSDNGGYRNYGGHHPGQISDNGIYRGQKTDVYEGGHRIPTMACWPGKIKAGSSCNDLTLTMDLVPTVLKLAGLDPAAAKQPYDGLDLAGVLFENSSLARQNPVCWRISSSAAIRDKNWKLVRLRDNVVELYNLKTDPAEKQTGAARNPNG
ncbi:MAG: sulfatase-like hydrolase/transferase [Planctomycetaceae bacterium]